MIAWLVRQGEVLLVATGRPAAGSLAPWHQLWKDEVVDRIDVQQLSATEVESLLTAELGGPVLADTVQRIWAETGGNTFHVRELAYDQRAAGTLALHEGIWVLTGSPVVGAQVLDVVRRDLDGLPPASRDAVELVALLGPVSLGTLLDVITRPVLTDLVLRGLVRTTSYSEGVGHELVVEMAHALYAQAVRARIPAARRREILAEAVANVLADGGAATLQTVTLLLENDLEVPLATVRGAVAEAFDRRQPRVVIDLVTRALEGTELENLDQVALVLSRADAWRHLDQPARATADAELATVALHALTESQPATPELLALVMSATKLEADIAQFHDDDVDAALAALARTSEWLAGAAPGPTGEQSLLRLEVSRLTRLGYAGRHAEAQEQALTLLDETSNRRDVLPLVCPTGLGLLQAGRFDDANRLCRHYQPVALAHKDIYRGAASEIMIVAFLSQLWSGDLAAFDAVASAGLAIPHSSIEWAGSHVVRGLVAAARGAWSTARTELHAANVRFGVSDSGGMAPFTLAGEALAAAATGDTGGARTLLATVDALPRRATAGVESELRLLRLDTLLWLQDPAALASARELIEWARTTGMARAELEATHRVLVLERLARRPADPALASRARELATRIGSPRATAVRQHVDALAAGDEDLARIADRELNRRGLWLASSSPVGALTPREREIAALAAAGLSSRVIADRLALSVRTVDSHLARVFAKLGLRSRQELGDALR